MARTAVTVLTASLVLLLSAFRIVATLLLGWSFSLRFLLSPRWALLLLAFATGLVVTTTVPTGLIIVAAFSTLTAFTLLTAWFTAFAGLALLTAFVLFFLIARALLVLVAFTTVAAALGLLASAFL